MNISKFIFKNTKKNIYIYDVCRHTNYRGPLGCLSPAIESLVLWCQAVSRPRVLSFVLSGDVSAACSHDPFTVGSEHSPHHVYRELFCT